MLKDTAFEELAKRAGCSPAELKRAISTEAEETLAFDTEGEFITNAELETIKTNAGKQNYIDGKKAGEEMFGKELKKLTGLDIEGKNAEKVISAIKAHALEEAKIEPTKQIDELKADKEKLQKNLKEAEEKLAAETENFSKKLTGIEIEALIKGSLPDKLANGLTKEQLYKLYKSEREFTKTDEGIALIDPATKQVIKDKKLNAISITEDLKSFVSQFGEVDNLGRGAGDGQGKKNNIESFTKRTEVEAYFEKNETPLSERAGILAKAAKNEGFNWSE